MSGSYRQINPNCFERLLQLCARDTWVLIIFVGPLSNVFFKFPVEVRILFQKMAFKPTDPKQEYLDAWSLKHMYTYAWKRYSDAKKRGQTPRVYRVVCSTIFVIL